MPSALTHAVSALALATPFDHTRYFMPWRPIAVSPIGVGSFFTARGAEVLMSEVTWVWLPAAGFAGIVLALRRPGVR